MAERPRKSKRPPTTLVLLVRHGTTPSTGRVLPGRAPGLHLADAGREQAARLAERLAAWAPANGARPRIAAVYASPLERTRETAAPLAAALGLRVRVARGLIECDFGEWTGDELKKLMKLPEWATVQRYPSGFRFPRRRVLHRDAGPHGGQPWPTCGAATPARRSWPCPRRPIKAVVADALGTHLDLFQRIVISPCSVTAISYGPAGPTVLAVNSTGSLSELAPS